MVDGAIAQPAGPAQTGAAVIRHLVIGVLAGLAAGLAIGLVARIAMRLVVLATDRMPTQSTEGTLVVLLLSAVVGIVLGLTYVGVRRWLPGDGLRRGLVYGLLVLALPGLLFFAEGLAHADSELREGPVGLGIALFSVLIVGFGIAIALAATWLERVVPPAAPDHRLRLAGYATIAALGLLVAVPFAVQTLVRMVGTVLGGLPR
jgi:hypothetical protein